MTMTTTELDQPFTETESQVDLDRLQGAWVTVAGRRPVQLLFAGRHFTARFLDGDLYMGTFFLFVETEPREMVMWIDEGPDHHRGRIARCIYHFDKEMLRWCPSDPGSSERLTEFPPVTDVRHLCMVLQRERPLPPK
jgi:uncharacterized protein (TIGR03067 family)